MYVLRYTCLSVSRHVLFVSASIPVSICTGTYPSPYLHVFLFDICTYPSQYTARIPFVSELIPVRICLCPVCVCICNLMHIRPNIGPSGQPNYHTHTHRVVRVVTTAMPPSPSDCSWESLSMVMVHLDERQRFHNQISTFLDQIIQ